MPNAALETSVVGIIALALCLRFETQTLRRMVRSVLDKLIARQQRGLASLHCIRHYEARTTEGSRQIGEVSTIRRCRTENRRDRNPARKSLLINNRDVRFSHLLLFLVGLLTCVPLCGAQAKPGEKTHTQAVPTETQSTRGGTEPLGITVAKTAQNPFSSITIVNFSNYADFNEGPYGRTEQEFHIQPIIPTQLSAKWTLSTWVYIPLTYQPLLTTNTSAVAGLGDVKPMFLFLPNSARKVTWGIGPAFNLPTATNTLISTGKFSLGPAMLFFVQPGKWTIGVIANYLHSAGGPSGRKNVNQLNPFYIINYNLRKGWYVASNAFIKADWTEPAGSIWEVPVGVGIGRVMKLGPQLVNFSVVPHIMAVHNSHQPSWQLSFSFSLLFPKQ